MAMWEEDATAGWVDATGWYDPGDLPMADTASRRMTAALSTISHGQSGTCSLARFKPPLSELQQYGFVCVCLFFSPFFLFSEWRNDSLNCQLSCFWAPDTRWFWDVRLCVPLAIIAMVVLWC
jgi:hypothetical protein